MSKEKLKAKDLYEMWDMVEEMMKPEIEEIVREEWERRHQYDEEPEEFDFDKGYRELDVIRDYEMSDIALFLLSGDEPFSDEEADKANWVVKRWWEEKPRILDCDKFWEPCMDDFEINCFTLLKSTFK